MTITIDTERNLLCSEGREYPLFEAEAFRILSRQWMRMGWNLGHWSSFSWMGRQFLQFPDDVLRLGEMLWQVRPDVIVETGVHDGGSTLFFASVCRRVVAVERDFRPGVREAILEAAGGRARLVEGDSGRPETAAVVAREIGRDERVCVFLDSDHSTAHVRAELEWFAPLVTPGCYLVVADTNLADLAATPNGSPAWREDNPARAVEGFLAAHPEFRRERPPALFAAECDFTELSYSPLGWLKRKG
jgi:cephalosporin hydroxylase